MIKASEKEIREFIEKQMKVSLKDYSVDDDLFMILNVDSLDGLALLAKLEKKFDFKIPNESLKDTRSIRAVLNFLK